MKRVAFVVPRCGREVNGGAEAHCLQVAQRMAAHWDAEILTTCALDFVTWANHYPPGTEEVGGVPVRRFPVDGPRNLPVFGRLTDRIRPRPAAPRDEQERWVVAQGPVSLDLFRHIQAHADDYDAFIFFTYLYATTFFGLPAVADKAYLAPLAHDEWVIYLSVWDDLFRLPRGFLFNTVEERAFLRRRFPGARLEGPVVGVGVEPPAETRPEAFRRTYGIDGPFLLYIGRVDPAKGCGELFDYFLRWKRARADGTKLVLIGKPSIPIPDDPDVLSLGFVDEQTKWDALAACRLLVMPSRHESLNMAILEAWCVRKPVLVNGACDVLVGQCRRARGGLWYEDYAEFCAALDLLDVETGRRLGAQGSRYVEATYTWDAVEREYLALLADGPATRPGLLATTAG